MLRPVHRLVRCVVWLHKSRRLCFRLVFLCSPLPWLISVPAMKDESNIPRFQQRLEIRYDHRPALRHGSDELGVRPFNRMVECELGGRPVGSISKTQREFPSALNSGFHSFSQLVTNRYCETLSRISPESMRLPSAYILHVEPTFHSLSMLIPNRYCFMISGVVSACHSFSGVIRM